MKATDHELQRQVHPLPTRALTVACGPGRVKIARQARTRAAMAHFAPADLLIRRNRPPGQPAGTHRLPVGADLVATTAPPKIRWKCAVTPRTLLDPFRTPGVHRIILYNAFFGAMLSRRLALMCRCGSLIKYHDQAPATPIYSRGQRCLYDTMVGHHNLSARLRRMAGNGLC
jgi:hypothetical protein